jgi:hypothetical protein
MPIGKLSSNINSGYHDVNPSHTRHVCINNRTVEIHPEAKRTQWLKSRNNSARLQNVRGGSTRVHNIVVHLEQSAGKKTIGTLISKVKAKMQEFDQPKRVFRDIDDPHTEFPLNRGAQGSSTGTEPRWGASGGNSYQYESQQSFYNPNPPPSPPVQHQEYHTTSYQTYQRMSL